MGDRGNIVLEGFPGSDGGRIFLYTHWGGSDIYSCLAKSLSSDRGRNRWDDSQYLARIIADDLWRPNRGNETGAGLGLSPCDNEHLYVVVNMAHKTVYLEDPKNWISPHSYELDGATQMSFQEYIDAVLSCPPDKEVEHHLCEAFGGVWPWTDEIESLA